MGSIGYTDMPTVHGTGDESRMAAWLVPGKGYYNGTSPVPVLAHMAYDLMASGEVADSEIHSIALEAFNEGGATDEQAARLVELGVDECDVDEMAEDPDAVLWDHMVDHGCFSVYAPAEPDGGISVWAMGPAGMSGEDMVWIAGSLSATGAFQTHDRVRFVMPDGTAMATMDISG